MRFQSWLMTTSWSWWKGERCLWPHLQDADSYTATRDAIDALCIAIEAQLST